MGIHGFRFLKETKRDPESVEPVPPPLGQNLVWSCPKTIKKIKNPILSGNWTDWVLELDPILYSELLLKKPGLCSSRYVKVLITIWKVACSVLGSQRMNVIPWHLYLLCSGFASHSSPLVTYSEKHKLFKHWFQLLINLKTNWAHGSLKFIFCM